MTAPAFTLHDALPEPLRAAVHAAASAVATADGAPPLSDAALLGLRRAETGVRHLVAGTTPSLLAYARLEASGARGVAECVVTGTAGEFGWGGALLDAAGRAIADGGAEEFAVWAHGTRSRLHDLLHGAGFRAERVVHQLVRGLGDAPSPAPPPGTTVRPYTDGDDAAWLRLNAAAFAGHPEQGRWTADDLRARREEDWYDDRDLLLVEDAGELVGTVWLKRPPGSDEGEIYVLAVDPAAQGRGLGRSLVDLALAYLHARGSTAARLYVDGDNAGALRLYRDAGFVDADSDTLYVRPLSRSGR